MAYFSLDFRVGKLVCQIVRIQSEITPIDITNKYYEHHHSCPELHYVEKGYCEFTCQKKVFKLSAGDILIIPPRVYHHETHISQDMKKLCLLIDILTPPQDASTPDMAFYNLFFSGEALKTSATPTLEQTLERIHGLLCDRELQYINSERMRALCNLFLVDLFEQAASTAPIEDMPESKPSLSDEYIIDTFMALKFMPKSSIEELAKELHVSERHLSRLIKQKYHMNYREKSKETRLEIAMGFLRGTDKSISEIAELLGYSNTSAFSAFIKNATGKTPSEIRKEK